MAQHRRKGPRRKRQHTSPPIDDDLATLASVLAEYQLDNSAYGWFQPPWRHGLNAARLAHGVAETLHPSPRAVEEIQDLNIVINLAVTGEDGPQLAYDRAGQIYRRLVCERVNTPVVQLLAVSARCVQLHLANSHGGGNVYNELLMPVFLPLDVERVSDLVLECRCIDAIGTTHHLRGDKRDRQRSAFVIAWRRGLYLAAYSLRPV